MTTSRSWKLFNSGAVTNSTASVFSGGLLSGRPAHTVGRTLQSCHQGRGWYTSLQHAAPYPMVWFMPWNAIGRNFPADFPTDFSSGSLRYSDMPVAEVQ